MPVLLVLSSSSVLAQLNISYQQRSQSLEAVFEFEPVQGSGEMTSVELQSWEAVSSNFFATMLSNLNDDASHVMLSPQVTIQVLQQDRYVSSAINDTAPTNYGIIIEAGFVVNFQTNADVDLVDRLLKLLIQTKLAESPTFHLT